MAWSNDCIGTRAMGGPCAVGGVGTATVVMVDTSERHAARRSSCSSLLLLCGGMLHPCVRMRCLAKRQLEAVGVERKEV